MDIYKFNNKLVTIGDKFLSPKEYEVTITASEHGSVTASPTCGLYGTVVTLSDTPASGYTLDYFTLNGVAIVGNTFTLTSDVSVAGNFIETTPRPTDEVQIGNQIWKTKNLAIDDGQGGIYTQTVNYGQEDVVEYYYTWDAAVRVAASISGWHLPTPDEWDILGTEVGGSSTAGTKLKSTYGWNDDGNGTDNYGFTGFPAGYRYMNGSFLQLGNLAMFWTDTEYGINAYYRSLEKSANMGSSYNRKTCGYSVRLIKDAT